MRYIYFVLVFYPSQHQLRLGSNKGLNGEQLVKNMNMYITEVRYRTVSKMVHNPERDLYSQVQVISKIYMSGQMSVRIDFNGVQAFSVRPKANKLSLLLVNTCCNTWGLKYS